MSSILGGYNAGGLTAGQLNPWKTIGPATAAAEREIVADGEMLIAIAKVDGWTPAATKAALRLSQAKEFDRQSTVDKIFDCLCLKLDSVYVADSNSCVINNEDTETHFFGKFVDAPLFCVTPKGVVIDYSKMMGRALRTFTADFNMESQKREYEEMVRAQNEAQRSMAEAMRQQQVGVGSGSQYGGTKYTYPTPAPPSQCATIKTSSGTDLEQAQRAIERGDTGTFKKIIERICGK